MSRIFKIDFFELMFLAEACIPPVPIARGVFWKDLIDVYYTQLSDNNRKQMFKHITNSTRFNIEEKECELFYNRYNPDNQYVIDYTHKKKRNSVKCFKHNDMYMTSSHVSVNKDFITKITKIDGL